MQDEGNLSLLLREGYKGLTSYKAAVDRQLNFLTRTPRRFNPLKQMNNGKISHADIAAKAITQLVFNMGAKVIEDTCFTEQRTKLARTNHDYDSYDLGRCTSLDESSIR